MFIAGRFSLSPKIGVVLRQTILALACLATLCLGPAFPDEPNLGPGDRIRVEVFGRSDLSLEQEVQASGSVRLPLIGKVAVAGLPLDAVERSISEALAEGIEVNPSVLVTVVQWRPVYVLGDVRSPKAVEYAPDLTVLKAVTLAGGFGFAGLSELTAFDAARSRERLDTAYASYRQLQVRKARLLAERDGMTDIEVSGAMVGRSRAVEELVDTERRLFRTRQNDRAARLESLERLASTYADELAALNNQRETLDEELKIASSDVEASNTLTAKGLELRSRNSIIQRSRLDVLSRIAENTAFASRASANLQETHHKRAEAPIEQQQDVLKELAEVQSEIMKVEEVIRSESRILGGSGEGGAHERQSTVEIVREGIRRTATETTSLEPGDVVEITLNRSETRLDGHLSTPPVQ